MKKAIIVIISALYVISIVIIAFFGSEVRNYSSTVYVTDIVLNMTDYKVGNSTIYIVKENEKYAEDKSVVKYNIVIQDYNYFKTTMGNGFTLNASAKPADADYPTLQYSIAVGDQYAEIDINNGNFAFLEELTSSKAAQVKISSTDKSGVNILVGITAIVH